MNPKKPNIIYKSLAEELETSEDLVEDLIQFYYKALRLKLSNLESPRINVEGLGQFVVKEKLAEVYISKLSKMLPTHDVSTFRAYHNKKAMEEKLQLLNDVAIKIQEERIRKEEFIKNKNNESST